MTISAQTIPAEFTPAAVAAAADHSGPSYAAFHNSGEPYRSVIDANPWLRPPNADQELEWGAGWYYDTTVGRLHPDWQEVDLPTPTKTFVQLQRDFMQWGYCLIEDGVSAEQCEKLRSRVERQAQAERDLGIAHVSPAQQHLWALVNKGRVFEQCLEHDSQAVQAGPLIEHLLDSFVGKGWDHLSFISNISFPGCHPQGLHQDQSLMAPYATEAPVLVNTVYILQDVDQVNGGTLVIPGSHKPSGIDGKHFGPLPRPINLEAPAGTIMLMDGRLLHGGAVNRSQRLRYILTNSVVRPFIRQQECFHLTIRPEVLARASDKFLMRCGFQANAGRSMVEGYGYSGTGRVGDPNGAIENARRAMDNGSYRWVGELEPADLHGKDARQFTLGRIQQDCETRRRDQLEVLIPRMGVSRGE